MRFDCCVDSCVSFSLYPDADFCPNCGKCRWKEGEPIIGADGLPRKRTPVKTHVYFPIRHRILLWYTSHYLSLLMTLYADKAPRLRQKRLVGDFWSARNCEILRTKDAKLVDKRELAFCCSFDGTKAFKTRKNRFIWPIILTCLNLPPEMRYKRRNVLVVGFVPGPHNPTEHDSFLIPMVEEFEFLSNTGAKAWDVATQEEFRLKAHLVLFATDMPARVKLLRSMGFVSSSYCEYCQIRGLQTCGLHCPHKPPRNMPEELKEEQRKKMRDGRPCYNWERDYTRENARAKSDPVFRRVAEYMGTNQWDLNYAEKTGVAGKSVLLRLTTLR